MGRFVGHHALDHFAAVPVESRESHPHSVQAFVGTGFVGRPEAHHAFAAQGHPCVAEYDLEAHGAANLQRLAHRQEQAGAGQIASEAGDEVVEGGIVESTAQRGQRQGAGARLRHSLSIVTPQRPPWIASSAG